MNAFNFTAIDFETAQGKRHSICQVGLVRVENGKIVNTINRLVRPPRNFYFFRNIEIHGITPEDTEKAPDFSAVWTEIEPYIVGQTVVAHNMAFDGNCLQQTLDYYDVPLPEYHRQCTYRIYGRNLASLCEHYQIELNHHDALSDAKACAELYLMHLRKTA